MERWSSVLERLLVNTKQRLSKAEQSPGVSLIWLATMRQLVESMEQEKADAIREPG